MTIPTAGKEGQTEMVEVDQGLQAVIAVLEEDKAHIWTSIDLYRLYTENGDHVLSVSCWSQK